MSARRRVMSSAIRRRGRWEAESDALRVPSLRPLVSLRPPLPSLLSSWSCHSALRQTASQRNSCVTAIVILFDFGLGMPAHPSDVHAREKKRQRQQRQTGASRASAGGGGGGRRTGTTRKRQQTTRQQSVQQRGKEETGRQREALCKARAGRADTDPCRWPMLLPLRAQDGRLMKV